MTANVRHTQIAYLNGRENLGIYSMSFVCVGFYVYFLSLISAPKMVRMDEHQLFNNHYSLIYLY